MTPEEFKQLVHHLRAQPHEAVCVEFKHNNADPDRIGEHLSALSNSAALHGKNQSYILWGIDDATHAVIGTSFRPRERKIGNEELENWLLRLLTPRIDVQIHEGDFNLTGTGPMIEVFDNRMEITNPGLPLIDTLRFIDEPPRSRNETLAGLMRRMNICEERGSGIDKVIFQVELFQLPAPDFRTTSEHTIAVLYGPRSFSAMNREDRTRACYQHACLLYVSGKQMTNASLRERLRIEKHNYSMASRVIRDCIEAGLIRQSGGITKDASYVPFWA